MTEMKTTSRTLDIMIIDGNRNIRRTVGYFLRAKDHIVRTCPDGITGLKILEEYSPDIIVTAMKLPKMSGIDFLKKMKELTKKENMPVIFLSSKSLSSSIEINERKYPVIMKPFTLNRLLGYILKAAEE